MANAGTRKLLRAPINPTRVAVIDERGLAGQTYAELAAALELGGDLQGVSATLSAQGLALAAISAAQSAGVVGFATKAGLETDLSRPDGTVAYVINDPTPANNGIYRKSGAAGAGGWIPSSPDRVDQVEIDVAALEPARALELRDNLITGVIGAIVDSVGRMLLYFLPDGTMLGKLPLAAVGGLTITRRSDGYYEMTIPDELTVRGARLEAYDNIGGDSMAIVDADGRALQVFRTDGTLIAKLGLAAGTGMSIARRADGHYEFNAAATLGQATGEDFDNIERDQFAIVDNAGHKLLTITADGTITGKFTVSLEEIEAARGDRATLGQRLDQAINAYGLPCNPVFGEWYLRETRFRLAKRYMSESVQLRVACIGDSWSQLPWRWTGPLATRLCGQFGDAGLGWTSFGSFGGANDNTNARNTLVTITRSAGWDYSAYYTGAGPDLSQVSSSTPGSKFTVSAPAASSAVTLFYAGSAGQIRYRFDGGSWSSLPLSGSGPLVAALAGVPATAWTLEIEVESGTCILCGLDIQSTADGVRLHKIAATGSQSAQWGAVTTTWQTHLTQLAPHLITIMLGTNDQYGIEPDAFAENVQRIIDKCRAAVSLPDILLIAPCENGRDASTHIAPMADYAAELAKLAASNRCAFLDLQAYFGDAVGEYLSTSPRAWLAADENHPDPETGGRVIVDAVYRLLATR